MNYWQRIVAILGTRRGLRLIAARSSVVFVGLSGVVQLILAVHPVAALQGKNALIGVVGGSIFWGSVLCFPKRSINRHFENPSFSVTVKHADLFDEDSHLVVGFTDTFDTAVSDADVISPNSVQGQFLRIVYSGDVELLDRELGQALDSVPPERVEEREDKPRGKLTRHPLGSIAVIGNPGRRYYCVAYSRMGNDLVARSSVDALWNSLSALWEAIDKNGHRERVSMPVIGSSLARVDNMDHESLVKMILLSFVARSRKSPITKELTLIIHPRESACVNMNEVSAILNSL